MASFILSFDQIRGDLRSAGFSFFLEVLDSTHPNTQCMVYLPMSTIKINQM